MTVCRGDATIMVLPLANHFYKTVTVSYSSIYFDGVRGEVRRSSLAAQLEFKIVTHGWL